MRALQISTTLFLFLQLATFSELPVQAGADPRARELAEQVLERMGGAKGWEATRFISWAFIGQYQIWDKQEHKFRWEKDSLVAVVNTETGAGKVYLRGKLVEDKEKEQEVLEHAHAQWLYNSFWLLMPFRLLEPDTELTYSGEGKTQAGAPAEVLELRFLKGGEGRYWLWIDKAEGLVTQWAYFSDSTDAEPVFIRRWSDYGDYGSIKLAADRSSLQSDLRLHRIAVPAHVPEAIFQSPTPLARRKELGF